MTKIGVIGQIYENRKNEKTGKLIKQDDEHKALTLIDKDNNEFLVSYSSFKSSWRKVVAEVEKEEDEQVSTFKPVFTTEYNIDGELTLNKLADKLDEYRKASVNVLKDDVTIIIDGVKVLEIKNKHCKVLPDIFTYGNRAEIVYDTIKFDINDVDKMTVNFDYKTTKEELVYSLLDSLININLYGYIFDEYEGDNE